MEIKTTDLTKLTKEITNGDFEILKDFLLYKVEYKTINRDIKITNKKFDILIELTKCRLSVYEVLCYLLGDKNMLPLECMVLFNEFIVFLEK